jgi:lysyl-tRNA synthetase class 2
MQVVVQKGEMTDEDLDLFEKNVDIGDFVQVTGTPFKTKRGERSIQAADWKMAAKSLYCRFPDQWFGLKDEEKRLRERYLDLLLNPELRAMIERRAKFWRATRSFWSSADFLEVETPILETSPGGADARPFITHHNALDIDVYLRISAGELWQKELLIAGFPKVFEIGRIFRNEGQSREHAQDYTQLETYEAYSDMHKGMEFVKDLYRHIVKEVYGQYTFEIGDYRVDLADDWRVIDFSECLEKEYGINPLTCTEEEAIQAVRNMQIEVGEDLNKARAIDHLWKKASQNDCRPRISRRRPRLSRAAC